MSKSVYFVNCIKAIRHIVYGRDNRKPIADAIEFVKKESAGIIAKRLEEVEAILDTSKISWIERRSYTIYVNYYTNSDSTTDLTESRIGVTDDFLITDSRSADTVALLVDEDYLLTLGDSSWSQRTLEDGKVEIIYDVPHYDTYTLVLDYKE